MVVPGRAAIAFNGEIYNYVELREELRARGWTFASSGDTEVLLKGWLEWREGVFERLNGMWAMAIHDAERDAMVLSRDRFGEKPLFWTPWRGGVAFASEVKQLRCFPDVDLELNLSRAAGYVRTGRPYFGTDVVVQEPPPARSRDDARGRSRRHQDASLLRHRRWPLRQCNRRRIRASGSAASRMRSPVRFGCASGPTCPSAHPCPPGWTARP